MARIPFVSETGNLTPEQRRVVDGILGRRGGRIPGPFRFALHCPAITEVWHPLGEMLRMKSGFPLRLSELGILMAARAMDCEYVFNAHATIAIEAGIAQSVVDALAGGRRPVFDKPDEEVIHDFCKELTDNHKVSDKSYARAKELFGVPGVVELTALLGYYTMVSMTIVAHEMPLQDGAKYRLAKRG